MDERELILLRAEVATTVAEIAQAAREAREDTLEYAATRRWHMCMTALSKYDRREESPLDGMAEAQEVDRQEGGS